MSRNTSYLSHVADYVYGFCHSSESDFHLSVLECHVGHRVLSMQPQVCSVLVSPYTTARSTQGYYTCLFGEVEANGVAMIFFGGGPPGRCHPVHFPSSPEADQIQWGG